MKKRRCTGRVTAVVAVAILSSAAGSFGQNCPQLVDTYPSVKLGAPWLVKNAGPYAYVALSRWFPAEYPQCFDAALAIVETSNPESLRIVSLVEGKLSPIGAIGCSDFRLVDFAVSGDYLFVVNGSSTLELIDVSDPLNPVYRCQGKLS